jgi:hypothetical protein
VTYPAGTLRMSGKGETMETASDEEREVRPAGLWAGVAVRPGMMCLVTPRPRKEGTPGRMRETGEGGLGRQGRKRIRAVLGTPRRPFRGASVADSGAGWSRADNAGQSGSGGGAR